MKMIREYINEKFVQESDPIKDMGIGTEILNYLKPGDILRLIRTLHFTDFTYYRNSYIRIIKIFNQSSNNIEFMYNYYDNKSALLLDKSSDERRIWHISLPFFKQTFRYSKLSKTRLSESVNEKFTPDSDPVKDMGIGLRTQIMNDLKKLNSQVKESDVEIEADGTFYVKNYDMFNLSQLLELQLKYMPENKRKLVKNIIDLSHPTYSNKNDIENYIIDALKDNVSPEDILKLTETHGTPKLAQKIKIILTKLTRNPEKIKEDEENNTYVFIGYIDYIPVKIENKTYHEEKFKTENIVKIDKYNFADLNSISMMKIRVRVQYSSVKEAGVYMITIPKDIMDEDIYREIPQEYYDLFLKYKRKIA